MHRNAQADEEQVERGSKAGDDRYPSHRWKTALWTDGEMVSVPESALRAAAEKVGATIRGVGKKTLKNAAATGLLFTQADIPMLVDGKPIPVSIIQAISGSFAEHVHQARALGFMLDVRPARVMDKTHVRVRPRFPEWSIVAEVDVIEDLWPPDTTSGSTRLIDRVREVFIAAGVRSGIGDWRPSSPKRPGAFGRFSAEVLET